MNKIKKALLFVAGITTTLLPVVASQCESNNTKEIKMDLIIPYAISGNQSKINELQAKVESTMNKALKDKGAKFEVKINMVNSDHYDDVAARIAKGTTDLGFLSTGSLYNQNDYVDKFGPNVIQTYQSKYKGEIKGARFNNSSNQLQEIAKNEQAVFDKIPWSAQWNDATTGNGWNGSSYTNFYQNYLSTEINDVVSYQRGLIAVVADDETTTKIKQAWESKNLNEFLSYGLGIGKPSSGSKYQLPEALMKKQFNTAEKQQFKSLADIKSKEEYNDKITKVSLTKASDEKYKNIHIFFDNEASYSYTTEYNDKAKYYYAVNEKVRPNEKITFLTVTEPLPYNIGVTSKKVTKEQLYMISQVLNSLVNNDELYGRNVGFVAYSVEDMQSVENEIKQTLGE
ncbi:ABC transporter thiamine pyrophosphate-binding lipoprotein p37/Cypl [Mycoplasma sp. VS1572C]